MSHGIEWPQTIDGAGTSAYFAPPWAPAEGEIVVSVPAGGKRHLVLCVMDEDWGRFNTDDKLGEVGFPPHKDGIPAVLSTSKHEERLDQPVLLLIARRGVPCSTQVSYHAGSFMATLMRSLRA